MNLTQIPHKMVRDFFFGPIWLEVLGQDLLTVYNIVAPMALW